MGPLCMHRVPSSDCWLTCLECGVQLAIPLTSCGRAFDRSSGLVVESHITSAHPKCPALMMVNMIVDSQLTLSARLL